MTAVEWLTDKLFQLDNLTPNQLEILEQAKEMEKKHIKTAFFYGGSLNSNEDEYYEENFGYKRKNNR